MKVLVLDIKTMTVHPCLFMADSQEVISVEQAERLHHELQIALMELDESWVNGSLDTEQKAMTLLDVCGE